jgi:hypothetical protein
MNSGNRKMNTSLSTEYRHKSEYVGIHLYSGGPWTILNYILKYLGTYPDNYSETGFFSVLLVEGTIQLTSKDSEDAQKVAEHIIDEIRRVGADKIIQVVTDTCSVMRGRLEKIIEKQLPVSLDHVTCARVARTARAQPRAQGIVVFITLPVSPP